jgi:WxL Interacting Protein, peptidoglycan binding domain
MKVFQAGRRAIALGAIAVLASVASPAAAASAAGPTFALKPASPTELGYFVFEGRPGATIRGKVRVINVGSKAGRTTLYAVDATTGQTSGAVYRSRQEPRRGVGKWTSLGTGTIQLAPGQSRVVPFSVHVPMGALAGQHLGGIVAQRSTSTSSSDSAGQGAQGTFRVKIQALSVIALQVNLPGPQRVKMSLSGIKVGNQPGHQSLLLGIGNPGNVLLEGGGSLKVFNRDGRLVKSQRFNLDTFVPETHVDFPVYVQGKALRPGRYRGTVTIGYRGHRLTRTFPFAISTADTKQVFGSQAAQIAPSSSSGGGETALYLLAGVSVLSAAAAGFFFMRSRGIV